MSARAEKQKRRAEGLSKQARREQEEFEALVRSRSYELAQEPIGDRWAQRRWNLALGALVVLTAALLFVIWAGVR